ncbi:MAG: M1 family metallopeptidase [Balneolales bacterium]
MNKIHYLKEGLFFFVLSFALYNCSPSAEITKSVTDIERPIPYPIDIPDRFTEAVESATRSETGAPGRNYWQQFAEYTIYASLHPDEKHLESIVNIVYHNNSPDTLNYLHLDLIQNHHTEGIERNRAAEVTGGMNLVKVEVDGDTLEESYMGDSRYIVTGTRLILMPTEPMVPGEKKQISIEYNFDIPQSGAGGRMGYDGDNLFYLGYWYPQMTVYDDVVGWHPDQYLGLAEFYHGFSNYEYHVDVPSDWVVMGTGEFLNPGDVLTSRIYDRYQASQESDEVVNIIKPEDFGFATRADLGKRLTWKFHAESVRDVAFSATRESMWDGARTPVNDFEYTHINTFYRELAPLWEEVTAYQQHAITFLSELTDFSYPWPHMTAVEGSNIISGGMEFPMMTIMGDYNNQGADLLYNVTAHELAHMWVPMIVSTDERRYSWMDEGNTSFSTNEARMEFHPGEDHHEDSRQSYIRWAESDYEGAMMRRSDFHKNRAAFSVASYSKPASVLAALRGVLGEEVFYEAYQTFINDWAFKHAYPWDMFRTFETVSGKDLEWFWRSWYYETWTLDQAITDVRENGALTEIIVEDLGELPMPVNLTITLTDGETVEHSIPVDIWLKGFRVASLSIDEKDIQRVEIDARRNFPDVDLSNNIWEKE